MISDNKQQIKEVLGRGVEKIYPSKKSLEEKLNSNKKIKLYCGYDPTAESLHIGHAITLRKLSQFQKLGHKIIMLIGDFTGMIGDPTDKTSARKKLSREEVLKNSKNYKKMAAKILDFNGKNPAEIKHNSKWQDKLSYTDIIELSSYFTVQQMIIRDMFQERLKKEKPIYLHEFLYPLSQAYDSVAMDIDLEVGGNDQTFNMLCGRDLMRQMKNKEKFVLTTKLLTDAAGKKMGKTEGNMVNLDEEPKEMFGKIMSWPDEIIIPAFELVTGLPLQEIEQMEKLIKKGELNPRDAKAKLAKEIVSIHHNRQDSEEAELEFEKIFKNKEIPTEIEEYKIKKDKYNLIDLLIETGLVPSNSEAKRLIKQGAVKLNNKKIDNFKEEIKIEKETILQVGKRKFIKLVF